MTKKRDLKKFAGKRIWTTLPDRGIRRRMVWSESRCCYEDPPMGALYEARRIEQRGGVRQARCFPTLQQAREWKDRRSEPMDQKHIEAPSTSIYLGDLLTDFEDRRFPQLAIGTRIAYQRLFKSFGPLLSMPVEDITSQQVSMWVDSLMRARQICVARKTRCSYEKELKALRAAIGWYIGDNDDTRMINPVRKKHFVKSIVRKPLQRNRVLSDEERRRWLDCLRGRSRMFWVMGLVQSAQMLRVSEVAAMKWSALDEINWRYEIREHVVWPRTGGLSPTLETGTKTRHDSYVVPLWEEAVNALKELRRTSSDLMFHFEGQLLTYRQIQYAYDAAFQAAGLLHRGTHVCRHTGATMFLHKTGDLQALQQAGAWSNNVMPQHYAKIRAQRAESAMRDYERGLKVVAPGAGYEGTNGDKVAVGDSSRE